MNSVTLVLSNGKKIKGHYDEGDFDGIYEDWEKDRVMGFLNCCVKGNEVIGMEYEDVPSDTPMEVPGEVLPYWNSKGKLVLSSKDNTPQQNNKAKFEMFLDSSYYDMWCVRSADDRRFNSPMSFHFNRMDDATEFKRLIELAR